MLESKKTESKHLLLSYFIISAILFLSCISLIFPSLYHEKIKIKVTFDKPVTGYVMFSCLSDPSSLFCNRFNQRVFLENQLNTEFTIPFRPCQSTLFFPGKGETIYIKSIDANGKLLQGASLAKKLNSLSKINNFRINKSGIISFRADRHSYLRLKYMNYYETFLISALLAGFASLCFFLKIIILKPLTKKELVRIISKPYAAIIFILAAIMVLHLYTECFTLYTYLIIWTISIPFILLYFHRKKSNGSPRNRFFFQKYFSSGLKISLLSCFLFIFGIRLILVGIYGVDIPILDQWNGEIKSLYVPYLNGTLNLQTLLQPHNEHRILFSRLLSLAQFIIFGKYHPIITMAVQACIPALTGTLLVYCLRKTFRKTSPLTAAIICLVFSFPASTDNLLWSFQSQIQIIPLLAISAFWLTTKPDLSWKTAAGLMIAFASSLNQAIGISITVIILIIFCYYAFIDSKRKKWIPWVFAAAFLCAIQFFAVHNTSSPQLNSTLNPVNILINFAICMNWPFGYLVSYLIIWLPIAILASYLLIKKHYRLDHKNLFSFAMISWVLLIITAIVYKREYFNTFNWYIFPIDRYKDFLVIIIPASLLLLDIALKSLRSPLGRFILSWNKILLLLLIILYGGVFHKLSASILHREGSLHSINYALNIEKKQKGAGLKLLRNKLIPHHDLSDFWKHLHSMPLEYYPSQMTQLIRPLDSGPSKNLPAWYPTSPSGTAIGSFIPPFLNNWQGTIRFSPISISVPKCTIILGCNIYTQTIPSDLSLKIIELPSNKSFSLKNFNRNYATNDVRFDWFPIKLNLSPDTKKIIIELKDNSKNGWLAIGGIIADNSHADLYNNIITYTGILLLTAAILIFCFSAFATQNEKNEAVRTN